jgi:hypothetical protein
MGCFESLVKSRFLADVSSELSLARKAIKSMSQISMPAVLYADRKVRKEIYDDIAYQYYLIEEMAEMLAQDSNPSMIWYLQFDDFIFLYSRKKNQIDEAILYNYNINGDFPYYRGRHVVNKMVVHTVLMDTRISFDPLSPN